MSFIKHPTSDDLLQLLPCQVLDVKCRVSDGGADVSWAQPWNVATFADLARRHVVYEVFVLEPLRSVTTPSTFVKLFDVTRGVRVLVRAGVTRVDAPMLYGPYSRPVSCA